jgi:energy-coupling factor transport system ATP-binding protein
VLRRENNTGDYLRFWHARHYRGEIENELTCGVCNHHKVRIVSFGMFADAEFDLSRLTATGIHRSNHAVHDTPMTSHTQDTSHGTGSESVPLVAVRNLSMHAGDRAILDDVTLEIHRGEYTALMGSNGSGKTTLIRHFNAMLIPESGSVDILGIPTSEKTAISEIRGTVGLVFQDPDDQMVAVTVEDELAFGLENQNTPPDEMEARVQTTLDRFRLNDVRDRATTSLSGGEQQRVAIAGIWITDPALLILDEPTSMLDRPSATELLRYLDELHTEHPDRAIVHVTQSVNEARRANRVIIMQDGAVVLDGMPVDVLSDANRLRNLGILRSTVSRIQSRPISPTTPVTISAENVHHTRRDGPDERSVLHGISADIPAGTVFGMVGRSGSGKTTLAWHLNRLLNPSEGRVLLDGRDMADLPALDVHRRVGLTFQRVDLQLFEPTVIEDVAFGPLQKGISPDEAQSAASDALRHLGLDPDRYGQRRPGTLSVGEQRRVALAGVLALEPEVLVLDEPTSGLDARGVDSLSILIRELADAGRTIAIVTHDLGFARVVADRVLHVEDGRGVVSDDVVELLEQLETNWTDGS